MNKKIKLIRLFNERAANEEMPKRIKFEGDIFELDEDNVYKDIENDNFLVDSINFNLSNLNDYVEILEDEEEIDIQELEDVNLFDNGQNFNDMPIIIKSYDDNFTNINNTINKLIQAVKRLDKKNK